MSIPINYSKWKKVFIEDMGWDRHPGARVSPSLDAFGPPIPVAQKRGVSVLYYPQPKPVEASIGLNERQEMKRERQEMERAFEWWGVVSQSVRLLAESHGEVLIIAGQTVIFSYYDDLKKEFLPLFLRLPPEAGGLCGDFFRILTFTLAEEDDIDFHVVRARLNRLRESMRGSACIRRQFAGNRELVFSSLLLHAVESLFDGNSKQEPLT